MSKKKLALVLGLDASEYERALKGMNKEHRAIERQTKALKKSFWEVGDSVGAMGAEIKATKKHIETHTKALKKKEDALEKMKKQLNAVTEAEKLGANLTKQDISNKRKQIEAIKQTEEAIKQEKEAIQDRNTELENYEKAQKMYAEGRNPRGNTTKTGIERGAGQMAVGSALSGVGDAVTDKVGKLGSLVFSTGEMALDFRQSMGGALRLAGEGLEDKVYELGKEFFESNNLNAGDIGEILEMAVTQNGDDIKAIREYSQGMIEFIGSSGLPAAEAMQSLSTVLNITGGDYTDIPHITSAINGLENKFGADTGRTFELSSTAMKSAATSGYNFDYVAGLGGFLEFMGTDVQGGGTALGKVLTQVAGAKFENKEAREALNYYGSMEDLQKASIQDSKSYSKYVKSLGVDRSTFDNQLKSLSMLTDVAKNIGKDVNEVSKFSKEELLFEVLKSIRAEAESTGKTTAEVLASKEYKPGNVKEMEVWNNLVQNLDKAQEFTETASENYTEGTSTKAEYEKLQKSKAAEMQTAKNKLQVAYIELGEALLPAMAQVIEAFTPWIKGWAIAIKSLDPNTIRRWALELSGVFAAGKTLSGVGKTLETIGKINVWRATRKIKKAETALDGLANSSDGFKKGFFDSFKQIFSRSKKVDTGGELLGETLENVAENVTKSGDDLASGVQKAGKNSLTLGARLGNLAGSLTLLGTAVAGLTIAANKFESWREERTSEKFKGKPLEGLDGEATKTVSNISDNSLDTAKINSAISGNAINTFTGDDTAGQRDLFALENVEGQLEKLLGAEEELKIGMKDAKLTAEKSGEQGLTALATVETRTRDAIAQNTQILSEAQERGGQISAEQAEILRENGTLIKEGVGAIKGDSITEASKLTNGAELSETVRTKEDYSKLSDFLAEQLEKHGKTFKERESQLIADGNSGKISRAEQQEQISKMSTERDEYLSKVQETMGQNYAANYGTGFLSKFGLIKESLKLSKGENLFKRFDLYKQATSGARIEQTRQKVKGSKVNVSRMEIEGVSAEQIEMVKTYNKIIDETAKDTKKLNQIAKSGNYSGLFDGIAVAPNALKNLEKLRKTLEGVVPPEVLDELDSVKIKIQNYENLTPKQKKFLIDSNPALAGLRDGSGAIKSWDAMTPEEKALLLAALTDEALMKALNHVAQWDQTEPETQTLELEADTQQAVNEATAAVNTVENKTNRTFTIGIKGLWQGVSGLAGTVWSGITSVFAQHGMDNFKGGLAVLGDGNREEKVILPDGREFNTGNRDELWNLPKGTKVHPDARLYDMLKKDIPHFKNGIGTFNFSNSSPNNAGSGNNSGSPITVNSSITVNGGQFNEKTLSTLVAKEITKEVSRASRAQEASGRGKRRRY